PSADAPTWELVAPAALGLPDGSDQWSRTAGTYPTGTGRPSVAARSQRLAAAEGRPTNWSSSDPARGPGITGRPTEGAGGRSPRGGGARAPSAPPERGPAALAPPREGRSGAGASPARPRSGPWWGDPGCRTPRPRWPGSGDSCGSHRRCDP